MLVSQGDIGSLGVFILGALTTTFSGWQMLRIREDVLIIDEQGIRDRRLKMFVAWHELERISEWAIYTQLPPQRIMNLKIKEEYWPDVSGRLPHRFQRRMSRFAMRTVAIHVNLLNARAKRISETILDAARARGVATG